MGGTHALSQYIEFEDASSQREGRPVFVNPDLVFSVRPDDVGVKNVFVLSCATGFCVYVKGRSIGDIVNRLSGLTELT